MPRRAPRRAREAYALTDSPVGLAAWIVEKFRSWSDCGGEVERCFTKDSLLTDIMHCWVTGAIGSSFWPYCARRHEPWPIPDGHRIAVPTAYAAFPREIVRPPRSLAALEQPEALAADIRAFFRTLR